MDKPYCIQNKKRNTIQQNLKKTQDRRTKRENNRDTKQKHPLDVNPIEIRREGKAEGDKAGNWKESNGDGTPQKSLSKKAF